jgi:vancomycin resistance protein VanW
LKRILLVVFSAALTINLTAGCLKSKGPTVNPHPRKNNVKAPNPAGTYSLNNHPYGNPVEKAPLIWENGPKFKQLSATHQTTVRIAAFQTTLPDPLPGEEFNIELAADRLAGTVVKPAQIFSMNRTLGPYTENRGFKLGPTYQGTKVVKTVGGGICKIATTLYNVAMLANLKIVERRAHGMLVPYVPPGQDATVSDSAQDFKFRNNTGRPILIWAKTIDNTLYMAFYGQTKPPQVIWGHQILNREKTQTIYLTNPGLSPGERKIKISGADGLTVKSWITVKHSTGKTETRDLGIDYYRPLPRVIERRTP